MDAGLFFAVLWRSKRLVLAGALLGVVLAALSYGQPAISHGRPTLAPHGAEVWQSESQLLITQTGFPYGRAGYSSLSLLAGLSPVYAGLANGNAVLTRIGPPLGAGESVQFTESLDPATGVGLPFVDLVATAPTRNDAKALSRRSALTLQSYVAELQTAAKIPAKQRVQLPIVKSEANTKLVKGHKLSIPILVFMAVLIATISLVFLRVNLLPRIATELRSTPSDVDSPEPHARTAPGTHHRDASTNGRDRRVARDPVDIHGDRRQ
jgi:hypothetical protein